MLKWVRKRRAMSLSKKGVITAPPIVKKHSFDDVIANGSRPMPLAYPSEPPDDENMNEISAVSVDVHVLLPDGGTKDLSVNSNIPLMDLLVNIAASCRLNPGNFSLSVFSEETGKFQDYKASRTIGTLCVRRDDHTLKPVTVQLNPKKSSESRKSTGNLKGAAPFEMTKRFTVNLPHSQKKVLRVPAGTTLESIQRQLCEERHFDPTRYMFQLPGNPRQELNLQSTVGELQTNEINYVSAVLDGAKSMPDLSIGRSQSMRTDPPLNPVYMPNTGETKRKKGFFSFLKKDNKKAFHVQSVQNTMSHDPPPPTNQIQESPPVAMRRNETPKRPATMYAGSLSETQGKPQPMLTSTSEHDVREASEQSKQTVSAPSLQTVKENLAPAPKYAKKKRAPPPPKAKAPTTTVEVEINNVEPPQASVSATSPLRAESKITENITVNTNTHLAHKMHSRNSSDSSGYHELTLSGAESPDTAKIEENFENVNFKPQTDTGSVNSANRLNGDSGIRDMSPARRKARPTLAAMETGSSQTLPLEKGKQREVRSRSLDRPAGMKKKKAPPPPGPPPKIPGNSPSAGGLPSHRKSIPDSNLSNQKAIPEFSAENPAATSSPRPNSGRKEETMAIDDVLNDLDDHLDDGGSSPGGAVMQMVDNEDITVEEVEIDKPRALRPCSFIAPPPPDEPPPADSEPVCYDDIMGSKVVDTVDRGTETSDDSASYEPGSPKSSPIHSRAESRTSVSSVNTIEDINMGFELAIAAGQQTMDMIESDHDLEEETGYKNEMAQFVERMSKEIKQKEEAGKNVENVEQEERKGITENVEVEEIVLDSIPSSSAENSPRQGQGQEQLHENQEVSEITYDFRLESVPVQFQEDDGKVDNKEREVEEFSETITENIYPFSSTPAATGKVSPVERDVTVGDNDTTVEEVRRESPAPKMVLEEKVVEKPKVKKEKESFVLTLDDLQNVDFSGPRKPKPQVKERPLSVNVSKSAPKQEGGVTSPVMVLDELRSKFKSNGDDENVLVTPLKETGNRSRVKDRCSELSFTPSSEGEPEHMLEEKSISMMAFPAMRSSSAKRLEESFEKSESKKTETSNSESTKVVKGTEDVNSEDLVKSDTDKEESAAVPDALMAQYEQMQQQMVIWQQQLEQNQKLLATQTLSTDDSSAQLQQQLKNQVEMQQQMMAQMQQSMEALKLQSQPKSAVVDKPKSAVVDKPKSEVVEETLVKKEEKKIKQTVITEEKSSVPVPPPAPQMNGKVPRESMESPRGNKSTKPKSKPSRKFEPQLDPREELMIAIRSFGGRGALHKVTVKQTNWGPGQQKTS